MLSGLHNKKLAFAAGLVYFGIESLGSLALLPYLSRKLGEPLAAFWVLILAFVPLAQLAVSGFAILTTRDISAALARQEPHLIPQTVALSRRRAIEGQGVLLLILVACYFLFARPLSALPDGSSALVWVLFSSTLLLRTEALRAFSITNGFAMLGLDRLAWAAASLVSFVGSLLLIHHGTGLVAIILLQLAVYTPVALFARRAEQQALCGFDPPVRISAAPAGREIGKMYLMAIGGFLTMYADVLIAQKLARPEELVEYGMLSRFPLALIAIASLYVQVHLPQLSAAAAGNAARPLASGVARIQRTVLAGILLGGVLFVMLAPLLLEVLLGRSLLLPWVLYVAMAVHALLCAYIIVTGQAIISMGDSKLVAVAVPTAVLGCLLACLLGWQYGLIGIPIGNVLALLISAQLHRRLYLTRLEHRYA